VWASEIGQKCNYRLNSENLFFVWASETESKNQFHFLINFKSHTSRRWLAPSSSLALGQSTGPRTASRSEAASILVQQAPHPSSTDRRTSNPIGNRPNNLLHLVHYTERHGRIDRISSQFCTPRTSRRQALRRTRSHTHQPDRKSYCTLCKVW